MDTLRRYVLLIACACALGAAVPVAAGAAGLPASGGVAATGKAATPVAKQAPRNVRVAYVRWRKRLKQHEVHVGRNLLPTVVAADGASRPPSGLELRRSIHRMQRRWSRWLHTTVRGKNVLYELKVRHGVPAWGLQKLRSIAACESHGNPRAVGGGGAYRGMYQFSFSTWAVVGGSGDPVVASRWEQTWRAWLLLSRHGSGHWPVCG
jgi:hypothetical protein